MATAVSQDTANWPKRSDAESEVTVERIQLHDIRRQTTAQGLVPSIISGLKKDQDKESPSLLLWNDAGLSLFDGVLESPDYYPATREWTLLRQQIGNIVSSIASGDRLIELGAGNMKKTVLFLETLQLQGKSVHYFACDVDRAALRRCVRDLQTVFPAATSDIKITGLLGTYEDCAAWLNRNRGTAGTTLMWVGNSMANFTPTEASEYIRSFLSAGSSMIVGLDGCRDQDEIARSYGGASNRAFVLNGLPHANELLGANVFDPKDWGFLGEWNPKIWMHESFYVAQRDLTLEIEGEKFDIKKGDKVRSIRSGKWPKPKVADICAEAGGKLVDWWTNPEESYGVYLLKKD